MLQLKYIIRLTQKLTVVYFSRYKVNYRNTFEVFCYGKINKLEKRIKIVRKEIVVQKRKFNEDRIG